ncbi:GNAT family N-acetyltransferase [Nocardia aurea]|uniref:GNAT family N-acetyltransferase n=1 Tax=Nocardia aurea TaxID=2144174 RepID=A0ABV3FS69_9NOCA
MSAAAPSVRRLGPDDQEAIRGLHAGMDAKDSYYRFFATVPENLTSVGAALSRDDPDHCAVGAFVEDRLVGVANFVTLAGTHTAEVALVVAHDEQEHGIGTELLRKLAELARERGIQHFVADVMAANSKMMRLLIESEFAFTAQRCDGSIRIGVQL